jgi:type I restriction enzyme, S subunit
MSQPFPMVPLGRVITHRKGIIEIDDLETYKRCRVQLHAQGVVLRDIVTGAEVKTKQQQVCRAGEFLVAEIDAKVGGFGIVPPDLDGAIVSSHYFLFEIDESVLDRSFLSYFVRTPAFREQVAAQGSTNYAAIRPAHVLAYRVPLPPLEEQRRIVARIEALAAQIEEVRGLRHEALNEAATFMRGSLDRAYTSSVARYGSIPLADACITITDGDHLTPSFLDAGVKFIFVGNVSSGYLRFDGCKHVSREYYEALKVHRKPQEGDILYSAVRATLGIPAIVDSAEEFCFQRHVAIIKPNHDKFSSKFAWHMLRSGSLYKQAWIGTTGSAQPTVPLSAIRTLPIPLPPLPEQHYIVAYLDDLQAKVDDLRRLQAESAAEVDALLPSVLDRAFKGEL